MTANNAITIVRAVAVATVATTLAIATVAACTPDPEPTTAPTVAPTWTPVPTWTPTSAPTWTPVVIVRVVTVTSAPINSPTATMTPPNARPNTATPYPTPIPLPTATPANTPTATPAATPTITPTPTSTNTPTPTPIPTGTPTPTPLPADAPQDLGPLITFFNSTNGNLWAENKNWLSDRPLYEWHGLTVNIDGRVTAIDLDFNRLTGTIPPELGELDQLTRLDLSSQWISGVIPRELGKLTNLATLWLDSNDLTGPIPHELGQLPNLHSINLANNELSGEIPPSLFSSQYLTNINLSNNALTGPIPSMFAENSPIRWLHLDFNQLSGPIPGDIGRLRQLGILELQFNQLTGEIPQDIGQLPQLSRFSVSNNQLTGNIPEGFGNRHGLTWLNFDNNQLTGTIPEGLGDLPWLELLGIANNNFSGCIPNKLQAIERNNVYFANISICEQPARQDPIVPAYMEFSFGDTATPAQMLAVKLATQWLNDFIGRMGWQIAEPTLSVYVDDQQGLLQSYASLTDDCDVDCAYRAFNGNEYNATPNAAFVPLFGTHGDGLETQARVTARLIFHAMTIEPTFPHEPRWLADGLATLIADLAVGDGMGQPRDDQRRFNIEFTADSFIPLWEEEGEGYMQWDPSGAVAVDLLATNVGLRNLIHFFAERTAGETWQQTFERAFNISIPSFYQLVNDHHRNGYPIRELPIDGDTNWNEP